MSLVDIKRRHQAANGPWARDGKIIVKDSWYNKVGAAYGAGAQREQGYKNAEFIANSWGDMKYLLRLLESANEELSALRIKQELKDDNRLLFIPESGIGDVSDGKHTFNELYKRIEELERQVYGH